MNDRPVESERPLHTRIDLRSDLSPRHGDHRVAWYCPNEKEHNECPGRQVHRHDCDSPGPPALLSQEREEPVLFSGTRVVNAHAVLTFRPQWASRSLAV